MFVRAAIRLCGVVVFLLFWVVPAGAQYHPRPVNDAPPAETFLIEGAAGVWNPSPNLSIASESLAWGTVNAPG